MSEKKPPNKPEQPFAIGDVLTMLGYQCYRLLVTEIEKEDSGAVYSVTVWWFTHHGEFQRLVITSDKFKLFQRETRGLFLPPQVSPAGAGGGA